MIVFSPLCGAISVLTCRTKGLCHSPFARAADVEPPESPTWSPGRGGRGSRFPIDCVRSTLLVAQPPGSPALRGRLELMWAVRVLPGHR